MRTWQDAIHREGAKNSPATIDGCRNHGQSAIRRLQADQAPDTQRGACISDERSYNEFSASIRCRARRVAVDLRQRFCTDAAAVSTSRDTGASETGAACSVRTTVEATAVNAAASSDDSAARNTTTSDADVT
jgi:hypothetical protein